MEVRAQNPITNPISSRAQTPTTFPVIFYREEVSTKSWVDSTYWKVIQAEAQRLYGENATVEASLYSENLAKES
jgi:hypothetical protein